jgi:TIR domain
MRHFELTAACVLAAAAMGCIVECRSLAEVTAAEDHGSVIDGDVSEPQAPSARCAVFPAGHRTHRTHRTHPAPIMLLAIMVLLPICLMCGVQWLRADSSRRRCAPGSDVAATAQLHPWDSLSRGFDLFVLYAASDAGFVRGYLLPALRIRAERVLLVDGLTPGASIASEIDRGVARSRFTIVVLSPAYFADCWAVFGEQVASYLSVRAVHVIPLRLVDCELPLRLQARVALDFTDPASWSAEIDRLRALIDPGA